MEPQQLHKLHTYQELYSSSLIHLLLIGDEHNDLLVTIGDNIATFYMVIANRWGEVVYTTNDINKFWDGKFQGKPAKQGTYSYQVDIIGTDKRPFITTGTVNAIY